MSRLINKPGIIGPSGFSIAPEPLNTSTVGRNEGVAAQGSARQLMAGMVQALNLLPQPAWIHMHATGESHFNLAWQQFTGQSERQLRTQEWWSCLHPEDQHQARLLWQQCRKQGDAFAQEYRLQHQGSFAGGGGILR